ncbi:MAG: alpha/beta fold hydrolase [Lamprobacter sp.]|uniref:esterase/lipase family protein n=1 Tax=Lamprobacter sp. TaxID=3100796 RepID=UPI002B261E61|nr:alpha/beta fold hydrolase [Lamprobacter sp.]MEA3640665.1 alpha/beta fold hydrolase [Lamprobacter sp.]
MTEQRAWQFSLLMPFMLWMLGGCQSLAPPKPEAASEQLQQSLAQLASAQTPESERRRAENSYRRTLKAILPAAIAGDGSPPFELAPADPPRWRDPNEFAEITPVHREKKPDSGLRRSGLGAPAVGHIVPGGANAPRRGYHVPVTALALPSTDNRDGDGQLGVALADPLRVTSIELGADSSSGPDANQRPKGESNWRSVVGTEPPDRCLVPVSTFQRQSLPVAMDLEAPLDATRSLGPRPIDGLRYLLRADRFSGQSRITFLQPFDPDKRPLVLVHGLMTTPQMWNRLVRELMADPTVRKHYQFWFFYYPTAQPVPLSAMQLRQELDQAVAVHGSTKPIVLVGYSMGGVLARAQIAGLDAVKAEQIAPGVSQLPASSPVRQALIFEPRDDISRAVFMFTPHRGSRLATFNLALWVSRLIRLPSWVRHELESVTDRLAGLEADRIPTSIQGLSPDSPFLILLDRTESSVPTHSVIGNRGRRGELSRSSDGVVPYWSAHLPSAESEVVVPTGHGGFAHPLAIQELIRILRQDLVVVSGEW